MHLSSYWNSIWNWGRRFSRQRSLAFPIGTTPTSGDALATHVVLQTAVSGTHSGDGTNRCQQLTHNTLEPPDRSCDRCLVQNTFSAVKTQQSHYLHVMESTVGFFFPRLCFHFWPRCCWHHTQVEVLFFFSVSKTKHGSEELLAK